MIVSEDEVFQSRLGELKAHLFRCGYSYQSIEAQLQKVRQMPREVALLQKKHAGEADRTPLVTKWDPRWPSFNRLLEQAFPILRSCEKLQHCLPLVSYKRPANLKSLLVHTRPAAAAPAKAPLPRGCRPARTPATSSAAKPARSFWIENSFSSAALNTT